ncbi:MAG: hypothetical protein JWM59_92 [Verrucomicrobiales bacterium]|nr:hypothetical protein [Verrucomicrobiales bacterium]
MTSSSLPCPVCATPLILDQENAGLEVLCPGCASHLRLPREVDSASGPTLLKRGDTTPASASAAPPGTPSETAEYPKKPGGSSLPSGRPRSSEEEMRRMTAAGGATSLASEEAAKLAAERGRTVLPGKRMTDAVATTGAAFTQEKRDQQPSTPQQPAELGSKRFGESTPETPVPPSAPPPAPSAFTPISPKIHQQVELSPSPLVGGARTLPQAPAPIVPAPILPAAPAAPPEPSSGDEATDGDSLPRGGFRLNDVRTPQFVPQELRDNDIEDTEWGSKTTPEETARTRRVVTLALAVMLLIAGGVGVYVMRHAFEPPVKDTTTTETTEDPMKNVQDARVVLKRFLAAGSIDQMLAEVRHPEITRPRMERYFANRKITPLGIRNESASWGEVSVDGKNFISNAMELDDFDIRSVSLELFPGGPPKVDWESFVNWSDIPWADFLSHPPDDAIEFRVSAVQDDYYSGAFAGREFDMLCFKLRSPKKSQYEFCYGYCDKNSEVGSQILVMQRRARQARKVDEKGKPMANCLLRLRFTPEGKKYNQVMIEKMINQGWVAP